ncbi:MAG TPA: FtsK/SpoIIIE domain-containing protein [Streptosporangiaceae bacterium]|nr:FtsK/SpoIIIE domain-containing protein [Streptosporangiaceae bacterium]
MRLALTIVSPAARRQADVLLEADPATPVAEVAGELDRLLQTGPIPAAPPPGVLRFPGPRTSAGGAAGSSVFVDQQLVRPDQTLGESPIRQGCVVSLGSPAGSLRPEPRGVVEIQVAGGPAAGGVHRLTLGEADIGGATPAHIVIADPRLPALALRVSVDHRGDCTVVPYDEVPAELDREPLTGPAPWWPGQLISVGDTLLGLAPYEAPDAALHPSDDGAAVDFNRPPRLLPPQRPTRFSLPRPPGAQDRRPMPILMAVLPVLAGVAMAVFLHEIYMLAMCALSPIMLLGNHISDRRHGRRSHAEDMKSYAEHKARIETDAREALAAERVQRRSDCPDPAVVLTIASGPRQRLWERRRTDPDYLLLRVGTADLPSAVELADPTQDEHRRTVVWEVPDAPVAVPLRERGVLGVAGPDDAPRSVGRWLVAQAATLHSPNDLQLYVLTDSSGRSSWEWAKWLPHCRSADGRAVALIGNDAETVAGRIAELLSILTDRQRAQRDAGMGPVGSQVTFRQDIVVVFDGSRKLRMLPGAVQILREGPQAGIFAICLDADERLLPAECQAVTTVERGGLRVQQMSEDTVAGVRPDHVGVSWCARLARGMAPVRDVSDSDDGAGLPDACRLLDVLGLEPPAPDPIVAGWSASGRSTLAVLGESYDGPFGIDLRRDGPHGLVAGTTGSGKSELLQTLVASLAVANRPEAMTFVLVDYKGGSAFKDCVQLPHTVGMVTDLDAHLVERALVSLSAELTRREHILAAADAKDIEDYTIKQERAGQSSQHRPSRLEPLPRLLIVIDEFASMVRDLPDFVTGLVNIAQRGRSLGIHLILATQRPTGAVSADIRANTNLRIALRVTDANESADVIEAPEAAHISPSTPGRGYVRLGHASLVPFQSGRVGGRRPGTDQGAGERPWLARLDWAGVGRPEPQRPKARGQEEEVTDLKVLVQAIRDAARELRIRPQHSPWLPALTETLLLSEVTRGRLQDPAEPGTLAPIPYGIDDLPAAQDQQAAQIDLTEFGHLMAAGGPRSGRSQLLRTIAASAATTNTAADLHLYGIDCGNGALLPLTGLPHCGAVVTRTQTERAVRLITRLGDEVSRRQDLLAEGGFAGIGEQRAATAGPGPGVPLPHILVLLDRWEGFTTSLGELSGGELADVITKILGEGASAGVHLVMTGDRSLIAGRISSMTEDKLAFRLPDRDDYGMIGLRPRELPDQVPPGRAFRNGSGIETQVALLAEDSSGPGQADAIAAVATAAQRRDAGLPRSARPFRVDMLPARIGFDEAWQLRPAAHAQASTTGTRGGPGAVGPRNMGALWAMVGVGGDELTALGPNLADGMPVFIVGGPAKSGRSTVLATMARSLLTAGTQLVLVTPRPSPLRDLAGQAGVVAAFEGPELGAADFAAAVGSFTGPGVVIIDDAERHRDCAAEDELSKLISFGADHGHGLILGGDAETLSGGFGGWHVEARRARRGCLIAPQTLPEGDLIGVRLTRSMTGESPKPGRALLNVGDGNLITVTVPAPA